MNKAPGFGEWEPVETPEMKGLYVVRTKLQGFKR